MAENKTKFIVQLVIERWYPHYGFFGICTGGEWVKYPYEQQLVFNSYQNLKVRMKEWHVENDIANSSNPKTLEKGQFRYKIYRIEQVNVELEFNQADVDKLIKE